MLEAFIRNAAQTYEHKQLGKIRVVEEEGNPWFIAKDICLALGLRNVSQAIQKLDEDEVTTSKVIDSLGREQTAFVRASGFPDALFLLHERSSRLLRSPMEAERIWEESLPFFCSRSSFQRKNRRSLRTVRTVRTLGKSDLTILATTFMQFAVTSVCRKSSLQR